MENSQRSVWIAQWWPQLDATTRGWLIDHNGEELPAEVLAAMIAVAGGTDPSWFASTPEGAPILTDDAVDWIEEVANDEA